MPHHLLLAWFPQGPWIPFLLVLWVKVQVGKRLWGTQGYWLSNMTGPGSQPGPCQQLDLQCHCCVTSGKSQHLSEPLCLQPCQRRIGTGPLLLGVPYFPMLKMGRTRRANSGFH